ncbi:MAG: phospholipid carrier-dependent glycosyltransferase, partial [Bacteroidota bacterium]
TFNAIIQLFTNLKEPDTQCGFKLYPKALAKDVFSSLMVKGWAHDVEILYRFKLAGFAIESMPVTWEHIDDAKIKVFQDGMKMLFQTMLISILVKIKHFFRIPLSQPFQADGKNTEAPIFRFLFAFTFLFLLFFMPYIAKDYGITGDEQVQRVYGDKLLKHYKTNGEDQTYKDWKNLKFYGGLFDYVAAKVNPADDPVPPAPEKADAEEEAFQAPVRARGDVYTVRHRLNALIGVLLIFFTGLLARGVTGSWLAAWLAMLFVALSPRIFGHSMNNPKDIPFAAAFAFTTYHILQIVRQLPRPGLKSMLFTAVGIAAAISIRVGGILLIAYLGLFLAWRYLAKAELRKDLLKVTPVLKMVVYSILIVLFGFLGGLLFWPYAMESPIAHTLESLNEMSNFSTGIRMLFGGEHIWSDRVPWDYLPTWFAIGAPIFMLIGLPLGLILLVLRRKHLDFGLGLMLAFAGFFPVVYAILLQSPLYDGMRHFIFVYPALAVIAAWGFTNAYQLIPGKPGQIGISVVLALLLALPLRFMVKEHPYQYVYFNELYGGVNKAFAQYETDYWMTSMKGLCDWFLENIPEAKMAKEAIERGASQEELDQLPIVGIGTDCYQPIHHYLGKRYPNIRVRYVRYNDRERRDWDYGMFYTRFIDRNFLKNEAWPPGEIVYEEKVGDVTIGAITKRGEPYDFQAYKATQDKDFAEALRLYELEAQQHPKSEAALMGMANSALQVKDFEKMKSALDRLMEISDTYVSGVGLLGIYYVQTGQIPQAKATFKRAVELNYKYTTGYYYLTIIAQQENEVNNILDYVKAFDEHGGRIPAMYEIGRQVADQKGERALSLYLQAKLLYFQRNTQESYNLLTQSIQLDPDYGPAKSLMEQYQAALNQ